ncbi:MAG: hypothetical protein ACO1SX_13745 [Actinomycetota bacterium]
MKQERTLKGEYPRKVRNPKVDPVREARAAVDELREAVAHPVTLARVIEGLSEAERQTLRQVARTTRDTRAAAAAALAAAE